MIEPVDMNTEEEPSTWLEIEYERVPDDWVRHNGRTYDTMAQVDAELADYNKGRKVWKFRTVRVTQTRQVVHAS